MVLVPAFDIFCRESPLSFEPSSGGRAVFSDELEVTEDATVTINSYSSVHE